LYSGPIPMNNMLLKQHTGLDDPVEVYIACLSSTAATCARMTKKYVLVLSQHVILSNVPVRP
jgi:hypothetical protein